MDEETQRQLRSAIGTLLPHHTPGTEGRVLLTVVPIRGRDVGGGLAVGVGEAVVITIVGMRGQAMAFHAVHKVAVDMALRAGATSVSLVFV